MLPDNIKVVVLSRGRTETIRKHTLKLMPYATVTVDESEMDAYASVVPSEQLVPHPTFPTMAHLRNWINDTFTSEFVYHVHDDLSGLRSLVGWRARHYDDPGEVAQVLERCALCARDAGAYLFGFGNIAGGTPHYNKFRPFRFNCFVRNVIGHRAGHGLRWDPAIKGHFDVDFALQSLMKHRIVWRDERWVFDDAPLASNTGGASRMRTQEWVLEGRKAMMDKWGPRYVKFQRRVDRRGKDAQIRTEATVIRVNRRDPQVRGG